jgi:hypothetical protein
MSAIQRSYKMENIEIVEIETSQGKELHVIIDRGNGEFTSMPKAVWDEQQAAKEAQSL